jgi:hypothetical protein
MPQAPRIEIVGFTPATPRDNETLLRASMDSAGKFIGGPFGVGLRGLAMINPDTAVNTLPAVGGAIGGVVAAPLGPVASVVTAGAGGAMGELAKQGINKVRGVGEMSLADLANEGAIQGGAQGVGLGAGAALGWMAPKLMQSALKPTTAMLEEYGQTAKQLAQTMLEEGVNVTYGGIAKLQRLLSATNAEIRAAIAQSPALISKKAVASRALPTAAKQAQTVNADKALADVADSVTGFLDHPIYSGPTLTMPEAQAMKVGTYRNIGDAYGEMSNAATETQKALARGLKEEIASNAPEVTALNLRDSKLMAALDATGRRVAVAGNRDPVGFAWVTHHPQTFLMALLDRSPLVKSLISRGMYESAGKTAQVSPQLIRAAVVAIASEPDKTTVEEPTPVVPAAALSGQAVSMKDLVRMATALGTTVAEQERRAKAEGYRVGR